MFNQKKTTLVLVVILGLIATIFFFPKSNGGGGVCPGCEITDCKCFGFKITVSHVGPWHSTCYGIPHSCSTYEMTF